MIDNLRDQIQQRIDELSDEADRLRAALTALGGAGSESREASTSRADRSTRRSTADGTSRRARRSSGDNESASPRRRSTGTRAAVLEALRGGEAMTASQVAQQTGLGRASVSTTLSKLARSGEVHKAQRGYQLTSNGNGASGADQDAA